MLLLIFSSLLGALNFITTIIPASRARVCGPGHYRMRGFSTIHTEAEYEAWLAEETALLAAP